MSDIKFPKVSVKLTGEDGNAFFMVGRTRDALRKARVSNELIEEFSKEALSGDYNHVIQTIMAWVEVS